MRIGSRALIRHVQNRTRIALQRPLFSQGFMLSQFFHNKGEEKESSPRTIKFLSAMGIILSLVQNEESLKDSVPIKKEDIGAKIKAAQKNEEFTDVLNKFQSQLLKRADGKQDNNFSAMRNFQLLTELIIKDASLDFFQKYIECIKNLKSNKHDQEMNNVLAIGMASLTENPERAFALLEKNSINIGMQAADGMTALFFLIQEFTLRQLNKNNEQIINAIHALLKKDRSLLEKKIIFKETVLHLLARWRGRTEIVKELLKYDEDKTLLREKNDFGQTVLECALDNPELIEIFINHDPELIKSEAALRLVDRILSGDRVEILRPLLACIPELINQKNEWGNTLLHRAILNGSTQCVRLLIEQAPKLINETNNYGYNPLHSAASKGDMEVIQILLKCNSTLNRKKDKEGWTPLHVAAAAGHAAAALALLFKVCRREKGKRF